MLVSKIQKGFGFGYKNQQLNLLKNYQCYLIYIDTGGVSVDDDMIDQTDTKSPLIFLKLISLMFLFAFYLLLLILLLSLD